MTVDDKIQEAKRGLQRIKNAYPSNQIEVQDFVNTFLDSVNSIPDHLLHDYSEKYKLGISLNDKLFPSNFEETAKKQNKQDALNFINWWKQEKRSIESTLVGSVLTQKRDHNTHRITARQDLIKVGISESIKVSASVSVMEFPVDISAEEALKQTRESNEKNQPQQKKADERNNENANNSTVDLHFQELPSINVVQACTQLLNMMETFVKNASSNFP